ncbi:MAG: IPT/TIG domain-containing protein [Planctomycetes bacterium]|nr:IPT/TIG domain-containing protein [Planctomycetota bacterium]
MAAYPDQLASGGHIVAFRADGVVIASGSHVLRVDFIDAQDVAPVRNGPRRNHAATSAVAGDSYLYRHPWDGIDVLYEAPPDGIVESTYYLAPGANAGRLRLRYNVPVHIDAGGALHWRFETGELTESAPRAWQERDGKRVAVDAAFRVVGEREVGFTLGSYDPAVPLVIDPVLQWNTFLGSSFADVGYGIAVDGTGKVYVTGTSTSAATWGSPVNPPAGNWDVFVAALDAGTGARLWNTFLGSSSEDYGYGIAVDATGKVYVTGYSQVGTGFAGSWEVFVAALDAGTGACLWNKSLGTSATGTYAPSFAHHGIAADGTGKVYVAGYSLATWGTPVNPFAGEYSDAFVAALDAGTGACLWNTFLGSSSSDYGGGIAVDGSGKVYVTGSSDGSWGSPVDPFAGPSSGFVAALDTDTGARLWNTFLGGASGRSIAVDRTGTVYVTGSSDRTWGSPVTPFAGYLDAFVAAFDASTGARLWNTFLGSSETDEGDGIAVDATGHVYVTGTSYPGSYPSLDAFVAAIDAGTGARLWNTFLGSSNADESHGIAVDGTGQVYVTGYSQVTWGSPVNPFAESVSGRGDAFVAALRASWTTTTVAASPSPSVFGQSVTFTANVTSGAAAVTSGTVEFRADGSTIAGCDARPLDGSGQATCSTSVLVVGTHTITAEYSGGADYGASEGSLSGNQIVGKAPATVTLGGLSQTYDGTERAATATTTPSGLTVLLTYDGFATAPVSVGTYAVVATVQDINYQGTATATLTIKYAAPTVTSITPSSGPVAGGTPVTVTGTSFVSGATVTLGGVPTANVVVVSPTSITATTGTHAAGVTSVVVTNADAQTGTLANGFTYVAPPTVTAVQPTSGPVAGGTPVTIAGTGFVSGASVTMGGVAATSVTVVSASSITARTPAHATGAVAVAVTNPDGQTATLAGGYTYVTRPPLTRGALDFNGDDTGDRFRYNPVTGSWTLELSNADGTFTSTLGRWSPDWSVFPGDFNGDGLSDLFVYNPDNGSWYKCFSDGAGGFSYVAGSWSPNWQLYVGDYNGDGKSDVFVYNPMTGAWYTCLTTGTDGAGFSYVGGTWSPAWQVYPLDLDGNGLTDLFAYHDTSGVWYRCMSTGTGGFTYVGGSWSPHWQVHSGDFNGDGLSDLFLYNPTNGNWFVCWNTGSGFVYQSGQWSPGWTVAVADLDGDGRSDVFVYNAVSGMWYQCVTTGQGFDYYPGQWSPAWELHVSDFNADGRSDLLVYNPATGLSYTCLNTGLGRFDYFADNWGPGWSILASR